MLHLQEYDDSIEAHVGQGMEIFLPLQPTVQGGLYEDGLVEAGDDPRNINTGDRCDTRD